MTSDLLEENQDLRKQVAELEEKISVLLSCKNCPENNRSALSGVKWHDLQKNPDNLPPMSDKETKISHSVWIHIKNWGTDRGYYDYGRKLWIVGGYYDYSKKKWLVKEIELTSSYVLAWCEIPKYKEN